MADRTIDSLLATAAAGCIVEIPGGAVEWGAATTRSLYTATAEGPVPSADGSLAVIRTDPELVKDLRARTNALRLELPAAVADDYCPRIHALLDLLAAPAPADPEEAT